MISSDRYPEMEHVFDIYFGQDFDLFGETVPEIVACYKKDSPHHYKDLIREIASFRSEHPDDLDIAYEHFRRGFRPEGDGYTVTSFFDEIQRLLKD
ncbi:hypothetical protein BTH42_29955 [Burkholderia sp. SRS-W-2-2016]|uniref:contact-dependent growth inhibition system immunity protein n=1 Tax=Burkholderia sp. SRS-W-2-2016 TaxID=1926878 RepID=UPI00094ACAA5|nr:contact-dependent growth inhibition system immunity protein [Burkholderia sp. SRS-W-2-2016]OLL28012.1 hypothetical protein BTH42_29955 [Burkholderia sp. SRS-W-2-2016]